MKLLIITAIADFETDIKTILQKSDIRTYTFKEVTGFRDSTEEGFESNWFASETNETESVLFYAFVGKENVDTVFQLVNGFNAKQESLSHIHAALINIERTNNEALHIV